MKTIDISQLYRFCGDYSFYKEPFLYDNKIGVTEGHFLLLLDKKHVRGELPAARHNIPPYKKEIDVILSIDKIKEFINSLPHVDEFLYPPEEDICPECSGDKTIQTDYDIGA